ncbi:MAG: FMN-binding protein [Defluviitaleaceae bacterium]|nr:FMN-binding protein [Defluviitaleaceae bacterium]
MAKIISIIAGLVVLAVVAVFVVLPLFGTLDESIWTPDPPAAIPIAAIDGVLPLTEGTFSGTSPNGRYGDMSLDVVVDVTGRIVDIIITEINETPSFADPALAHLIPAILATQSTGIDTFTGATETSYVLFEAVEDALVSNAGVTLAELRAGPVGGAAPALQFTPGTFLGIGPDGWNNDIHVEVTFTNTAIVSVEVVFSEDTASFADPAFAALIPAVLAAQSANVDTFAGATITADAFLAGVQHAIDQSTAGVPDAPPPPPPAPEPEPEPEEVEEPVAVESDEVVAVTVEGYIGPMTVEVSFLGGVIVAVDVVEHSETPMFFGMVVPGLTDEIVAGNTYNVDTVSGATYTADAIIEAVRQSIHGAPEEVANGEEPDEVEDEEEPAIEEDEPADEPEPEPEPADEPADEPEPAAPAGRFTPGTYTATTEGYIGPITVSVVFNEDNIVSITITSHEETEAFFNFVVPSFTDAIIAAQDTAGIDTVSGATYTAEAIRDAVNNTIAQASN